jgi:hypothetical protein
MDPLFQIGDVYTIKDLDTFIMNRYVLYTLSIFGDVPLASAVTSTTNNSVGYNHSLEVLQTSDCFRFHSWRRARYYIARPLLHLNDDHCPLRFVKERTSHVDYSRSQFPRSLPLLVSSGHTYVHQHQSLNTLQCCPFTPIKLLLIWKSGAKLSDRKLAQKHTL